jgi:hypothetical protein
MDQYHNLGHPAVFSVTKFAAVKDKYALLTQKRTGLMQGFQ